MGGADDGKIRRKCLRGGRAGIVDAAVIDAGAGNERRIALRVDDVVGLHQVVEDAEAAAYGGLGVAEGIVGEADAGSEVAVVDGLPAARQPGEKTRQAGVGSRGDAAGGGLGEVRTEDDDAVIGIACIGDERSGGGKHGGSLGRVEAGRQEGGEVTQRAIDRPDDVIAQTELEAKFPVDAPTVLGVELVLAEACPHPGVHLAFGVGLEVPEQDVGDGVAAGFGGGGIKGGGAVLVGAGVVLVLAAARDLHAELERMGADHLAEIVAPLKGGHGVLDAVARIVAGKAGDVHAGADLVLIVGEDLRVGEAEGGALQDLELRIALNLVVGHAEAEGIQHRGREGLAPGGDGGVAGTRASAGHVAEVAALEGIPDVPFIVSPAVSDLGVGGRR